jgi:hypothetical protein
MFTLQTNISSCAVCPYFTYLCRKPSAVEGSLDRHIYHCRFIAQTVDFTSNILADIIEMGIHKECPFNDV